MSFSQRGQSYDVFLSYSGQDAHIASEIAGALSSTGLRVYSDTDTVAVGENFQDKIIAVLNASRKVVAIWSERSTQSEWVRAEAFRAYDQGKLISIVVDDQAAQLMPSLIDRQIYLRWRGKESIPSLIASLRDASPTAQPEASEPDKDETYDKHRNASRVRVFIAHASNDKPLLGGPITVLVEAGFQVWIDKPEELDVSSAVLKAIGKERIHYGEDWKDRISRAIKKSHCVLACWSTDAIRGRREQFYYEIYSGMIQKKLVQCRIDKVPIDEIGLPYTFSHIADLSKFNPKKFCLPLNQLMEDISGRVKWGFWSSS